VEVVPFGREAEKRTVGVLEISNNGRAAKAPIKGNYDVRMTTSAGQGMWHRDIIKRHIRDQSVWVLVGKAVKAMGF
jgi:hypothetical protein